MSAGDGNPEDAPPAAGPVRPPQGNDAGRHDDDKTQFMPLPILDPDAPAPKAVIPPNPEDDRTQFVALTPSPDLTPTPVPGPEEQTAAPATLPPLQVPRIPVIGSAVATVTVGTQINNNYEVTQVLKSGGMGEVYRGVEIGTGDPVAIKAILPELAEDEKDAVMGLSANRTGFACLSV